MTNPKTIAALRLERLHQWASTIWGTDGLELADVECAQLIVDSNGILLRATIKVPDVQGGWRDFMAVCEVHLAEPMEGDGGCAEMFRAKADDLVEKLGSYAQYRALYNRFDKSNKP